MPMIGSGARGNQRDDAVRLIIVRHGKAERDSPTGRDSDRVLRPRGVQQAAYVGDELSRLVPRPDLILSSGFTRAIGTARVIQEKLDCALRIERALEAGREVSGALELIRVRRAELEPRAMVVVGHNPQLEELVGLLVHGIGGGGVTMKTGQGVLLAIPDELDAELPGACVLSRVLRLDAGEDD